MRLAALFIVIALLIALGGCGVSKNKYDALLNEKIALENKVTALLQTKNALKSEYDNLLDEKMELAVKIETLTEAKNALKDEYGKLLEEKIAIKTAYDKVVAGNK